MFNDDQQELGRTFRRFLQARSPSGEVRRLMSTDEGFDRATWKLMATQLGVQSLIIPEELGGAGFSYLELAAVLEEAGRALLCAPLFSTTMATTTLLELEDQRLQRELLPRIASGECVATLALAEQPTGWDPSSVATEAYASPAGWRLRGRKNFVVDGHVADLLLVSARTGRGLSLFVVEGNGSGVTRRLLASLDQTRKLAEIDFADAPARLAGPAGGALPLLSRMLDLSAVMLAFEQVGGAQRLLEMAVDYAKTRFQFGRPIGSFQAIKHMCADMLLRVEFSRSAAHEAVRAAVAAPQDLPAAASLAKAYCSESYAAVATDAIQIHGGIGFTWEHDAHLYFKRAQSSQRFLGDGDYHRELLAKRLGV